jgi:hypothetical protein
MLGVGAATAALAPAAAVAGVIAPPPVYGRPAIPTLKVFTPRDVLTAADLNHNFALLMRKQLTM